MTYLIALDPGGTTGYACWNSGFVSYGHLGPGPHHSKLYSLLSVALSASPFVSTGLAKLVVICEPFENRGNDFAKLVSGEYIGVVNLFDQEAHHSVYIHWSQSQNKVWASDEKLKALGVFLEPKSQWKHANDAMRHLVHYIYHYQGADKAIQKAHMNMASMLKENLS